MKTKQIKIKQITLYLFFALFIAACSSEKDGIIPDKIPDEEEPNNNEEEINAGLIKSDFMLESVIGEGIEKGVYNTYSDAIMKDQWNRGVRDQGGANPITAAPLVYDGYIESGKSNSFNLLRLSTGARLTGYSLTDDDIYAERTYYLAFMIKVGDNTIAGDHVPVIMFDGTHAMDYQRIGVCVKANEGANSTAFTFGLTEKDASGPSNYTAKEYSFGTTYLLVLKYNMVTGKADLFINPKLTEGEPNTPDATVTNNNLKSIRSVVVRQRTNHSCTLGGLRFAKTWMSAIAQQ